MEKPVGTNPGSAWAEPRGGDVSAPVVGAAQPGRAAGRLTLGPRSMLDRRGLGAKVGSEFLLGRVELAHALGRVHLHRQCDGRTQQQTLRRGFGDKMVFGLLG